MKSVSRWGASALVIGLTVVLVATLFARALGAQLAAPAGPPACGDTVGVRSYATCPLSLDWHQLRRDDNYRIIARGDNHRVIPLSVIVGGDSARHYALRYEHDARVAARSLSIGGDLLLVTAAAGFAYHCTDHSTWCANSATALLIGGETMFATSTALLINHFVYRRRAWASAAQAIRWHDRRAEQLQMGRERLAW